MVLHIDVTWILSNQSLQKARLRILFLVCTHTLYHIRPTLIKSFLRLISWIHSYHNKELIHIDQKVCMICLPRKQLWKQKKSKFPANTENQYIFLDVIWTIFLSNLGSPQNITLQGCVCGKKFAEALYLSIFSIVKNHQAANIPVRLAGFAILGA